ncbi:MAG: response regulator [Desulfarculus sp.]|nr:response regulator [Desulfarculus sp.]
MSPISLGRRLRLRFALVALVPLLVVGALVLFWLLPQVREEISDHHQELAHGVAAQVAEHFSEAERNLRSLAQYLAPRLDQPALPVTPLLDAYATGEYDFEAIYIADASDTISAVGLPLVRAGRRTDLLGIDLSHRDFIAQVRRSGQAVWSGTFLSTVGGQLAVALAMPMGQRVLVGETTVGRLTAYVSGLPAQSRLATVVLDDRGQVIAHNRSSFTGQQLQLQNQEPRGTGLLGGLALQEFELGDEKYVGTVVAVRRLGWRVLVAQLREEALRPLRATLWSVGLAMPCALLLAMLAGWLLARGLAGDFARFTGQARALAQGRYDQPWPDSRVREFADLGADLQKMAVAIRQREEALAGSEARLVKAQAVAHVGSYEVDLASRLVWGSAEAFRIYGLPINATKTMDFGQVQQIPLREDRPRLDQAFQDLLTKGTAYDQEFRIRRVSDGELRHIRSRAELILDAGGSPAKLVGTIQDITERKQLERQLLQAQKMEAIGQLAGGVAHDFNNMLSVIMGYTELLRAEQAEGSPQGRKLALIEKAAGHSRDITRQLLAFSRKQIIAPQPQDLNGLINGTLKTLARLIGEDIQLTFHGDTDLWLVKVDPSQVDQILVNLAVNARDAMPEGGKLLIETTNIVLDEDYCRHHGESQPGSYVMLAVSDTGQGMDPKTVARIFEPFFTTKAVGKGTGLGLATVYGIVKQNGGFINVYSEPERGTTFKLYLPRSLGQDKPAETAATLRPEPGSGTILLVEDDDLVRQVTASMLEDLGYVVVSPKAPSEAVELCIDGRQIFDLLITDVVMPDMSGKQLRDLIKTLQPGIGVLFISGYTNNVIVHHGVLEEDVHFLAKPFNLADLARKVREAMA